MRSQAPIILIWVNSRRCNYLESLGILGLMGTEISILISFLTWIAWKKQNSPPLSSILRDFQNQEYRFTIQKSRIRPAKKWKEGQEEEHRQSQSVACFTQMQYATLNWLSASFTSFTFTSCVLRFYIYIYICIYIIYIIYIYIYIYIIYIYLYIHTHT